MTPSSKYASTSQTYAGGFVYKETNENFSALFPLGATPDLSVSYTTPINSGLDVVSMGGWNNSSASSYVDKELYFHIKYGANSHSNVNSLKVSKSAFESQGNVTIAFAKNAGNARYYYGKNASASAVVGSFGYKMITDFEVDKIVFKPTLLTGWTKADFEKFVSLGTLDDNDGYNISPDDFFANPSNYYIRTFGVGAIGYWDGSTWKANNLSNSPYIKPVFMYDTPTVSGICDLNKHHFDNAAGTGSYGIGNTVNLYNSTTNNTTEISNYNRGSVSSELSNSAGFVTGSTVSPLVITPYVTPDELTTKCASGLQGSFNTLPAQEFPWCDALRVLRFDNYVLSYDSGTSGTTHVSEYKAHFCFGMKGEYVSRLFAFCGVYFYDGDYTALSNSGATPTNMKVTGMRLGEMNAAGQTTGRWIMPNEFDDYTGINKSGSIVHPKYNPTPSGGNDGANEKDMNTITASGNAGMVTYYEINKTGTATATAISDAISKFDITQIGKDLTRNLVSYKAFAVLPVQSHLLSIIHVGGNDLQNEQGNDLYGDAIQTLHKIDLGTIRINRAYNDYRDFAPYTKIEMYVPFCGWFTLPSWSMGKTISGEMWVDLYNGTVKAVIKASRTVVAEIGGCCAYDVPFVAESTGAKAGAVISSALSTVGMTAATIATPNVATATAAISSAANLACALNANATTLKGVMGDGSNINGLNQVWIKVTRPRTPSGDKSIPNAYKHEYGIPCGKQLTLTAGDGFTQILDANITGAMTDREKQMIIDGFRHGLIL